MNEKLKLDFDPRWFMVTIFFLAGVFLGALGLYIWLFNGSSIFSIQKIHPTQPGNYKFINPLLAVNIAEKFLEDSALESRFKKLVQQAKNNGVDQAYVYFKEFEDSRWADWENDFQFSPGILLKIPIMIAYFKNAESNPDLLDETLVYHSDSGFPKSPTKPLVEGKPYTTNELIEAMIIDNDDGASEVLFDNINLPALNNVYSDLGIQFKENKADPDFITTKQYSLIFRVLYNATYLNRDFSEKALEVLHETSSYDVFAAQLPREIDLTHIYRSRQFGKPGQTKTEAHACGDVYYPGHPYNLCMTAVGGNSAAINELFKNLSELVYNDMVDTYNR